MKENWEIHWKDYYAILQIHPLAEPEVVKAAYDRLARKYHPDVNQNAAASQRMKDINEAYEILSKPEKRSRYDLAYSQKSEAGGASPTPEPPRPKPEIRPGILRFEDMTPGETRRDTFIIDNAGSPFTRISISKPRSWLKITSQRPLSDAGILPMVVELEARGEGWGESRVGNIVVKLDDVEAHVRVELTMKPEPLKVRQRRDFRTEDYSGFPDFREWLMEGDHRILIINLPIAYLIYLMQRRNSE